ncbi:MAG: UvrD-helicase domain-containing protein [Clostridia bacterium]|nr:UvrD-helicase domain-containing protein [Clostridia bacterium]
MQWTEGQQSAIDARNGSVLVSAAAGSGKTAVLVERVLSLLREGRRIDRMLIVTFTRAAAGEMQERIGRRLEKEGAFDAHLRRQALRLHRASICTLHVFCFKVLRENFQAADIDPLARIGDEDRLNTLRRRAQDEVLESAYGDPTEDEKILFEQFEDPQIVTLLDELYGFLMAQADPWGWAEAHTADDKASMTAWMPLLRQLCRAQLDGAAELMPEMGKIMAQSGAPDRYVPAWEADQAMMAQLLAESEDGTLRGGKTSFARLSTKKASPDEDPDAAARFKALREDWKDRINNARELLPENPDQAEEELRHTLPALRALCGLVHKMHDRYYALKQSRNYLDYNDLEHLTLKVLQKPDVRAAVAGSFDALFIDEYQDVSGIQEAILNALHEGFPNLLFMVGDVKQSIYRFRLADPTLFLDKYQRYSLSPDAAERKILLQQNFRSDENVLLAVNEVFVHAMREKETEITYDEAAMLRPGGGQPFGAPVEIHLITAQEEEDGEMGELTKGYRYEAAFVAQRIKELMRFSTVREGDGSRPVRFRDIALLVRYASGRAPYIARALQAQGIPVYSDADAQFFDLPEVVDMVNLLKVVDNPLQDIPLLSTLRCPCFAFTEEDLARIRLVKRTPGAPFYEAFRAAMAQETPLGEKCREAWNRLARWRFMSLNMPVDTLIWRILEESGLYMRAGALEEGELRQANLRLLAERAQGESAKEGLGAFLRETGRLHATDDGKSAKTLGENEDVVRILTLHKSKGLEFPIVFMLEMARPFRKGDGGQLRTHAQYGLALQYIDAQRRVTRETCAFRALSGIGEKEARAEEARLLYVGMTRAREKLILVGSPRKPDAALETWQRPATAYAAGSAGCMLDWVMQSLGGFHAGEYIGKNGSIWRMALQPAEDLSAPPTAQIIPPPLMLSSPPDALTVARMTRREIPSPPMKTSVTAIAKKLRGEGDDWESPADKRRLPKEAPLPGFMVEDEKKLTPAERGTITHRVLGQMDYGLVRAGNYTGALDQLQKQGVLSDEERSAVQLKWLKAFFSSPLGQRALAAPEVHREWAFNLKGSHRNMIQGVIDLCFLEDGQWVLADYKTDFASGEELVERYALQVRWYAHALALITRIPVKEACLFGLRAGESCPVSLAEPVETDGN